MNRYKLLAGQDRTFDYNAELVNGKAPMRTFVPGDIVLSDIDLVARHGPGKYQLLGQARPKKNQAQHQVAFPEGQVLEGFQETTSAPGDELDSFTDEELREKAEEAELDFSDEDDREALLLKLRS